MAVVTEDGFVQTEENTGRTRGAWLRGDHEEYTQVANSASPPPLTYKGEL